MWKEQKGRTSTDGKSQSAGDQGNGAVIHVEMWEERQDSTTDEGQRERMTETKHHVMMWEGRHTPKDSEQESNAGQQLSGSDRMRSERATQIEDDQRSEEDTESTGEYVRMWERRRTPVHSELDFFMNNCAITQFGPVDQQTRRERRRRVRTGRWRSHRTETTMNESTRTCRRKARQTYSRLQPTHEEVVAIIDRESYVKSSCTSKTRRGVTPRGPVTESLLDRQSAKGRALLRD